MIKVNPQTLFNCFAEDFHLPRRAGKTTALCSIIAAFLATAKNGSRSLFITQHARDFVLVKECIEEILISDYNALIMIANRDMVSTANENSCSIIKYNPMTFDNHIRGINISCICVDFEAYNVNESRMGDMLWRSIDTTARKNSCKIYGD